MRGSERALPKVIISFVLEMRTRLLLWEKKYHCFPGEEKNGGLGVKLPAGGMKAASCQLCLCPGAGCSPCPIPPTWHHLLLCHGWLGQTATFEFYSPTQTLTSRTDPADQQPKQGNTTTQECVLIVAGEHHCTLGQRLQPTLSLVTFVFQMLLRQKHHLNHWQSHQLPGWCAQAFPPCQSPRSFLASPFPLGWGQTLQHGSGLRPGLELGILCQEQTGTLGI